MTRAILKFSKEITSEPITSQIIIEHKTPINILTAHIDQQGGEILVEIPSAQAEKIIEAFRKKGVTVEPHKPVKVDKEKCISCGACFSLCPVNAIKINEDFSVAFNDEKCLGSACRLCVDTCPVRAIKVGV
jgi:formate hydrogenlyase subunit 6/NADH:ubiquinone oxidoreductase subunit I